MTALHYAANADHKRILQLLLDAVTVSMLGTLLLRRTHLAERAVGSQSERAGCQGPNAATSLHGVVCGGAAVQACTTVAPY